MDLSLIKYANKYMNIFISKQPLSDNLLPKTPVPTGVKGARLLVLN